MRGRDDDAAAHTGLGHPRHDADEVEHDFLGRMRDHDEVRVDAFGDFLAEFDVDLLLLGRFALLHAVAPFFTTLAVSRAASARAPIRSLLVMMV